jgi:hypothetical protein
MGFLSFLSGCQTPKPITVTQCSAWLQDDACFCRDYKYSAEYIGPVGNEEEHPIEACDKLVGFSPDDYLEVTTYHEAVRKLIKKYSKKN